jgi:hypothetical protein
MLRKTILALAAVGTLSVAALAPTSASAWGFHGGWHGGFHHHFGGFRGIGLVGGYYGGDCYMTRQVVDTPFGPRVRRVQVCD